MTTYTITSADGVELWTGEAASKESALRQHLADLGYDGSETDAEGSRLTPTIDMVSEHDTEDRTMTTGKHEWNERLDGIYYQGKKERTRDIVAFLHRLSRARRPMWDPEILMEISEEIEHEFLEAIDE